MKIPCWIKGHDWFIFSWENYYDTSFQNSYVKGEPSHTLTMMCESCKKTKVKINFCGGHIDREYLIKIGMKNIK